MPPRASTPPPTFSLPLLSPPPAPRRGRRLNPRNRTENINRHRRYASLDSITEMSGYGWEQDVSMDVMVFDDAEDCLVVYDGGDEDESEDTRDSQDEMDVEMGFQGGKLEHDQRHERCDTPIPQQPVFSYPSTTSASQQRFVTPFSNTDMAWEGNSSHTPVPPTPRLTHVKPVPFSSPPVLPSSSPPTFSPTTCYLPKTQQHLRSQTMHYHNQDPQTRENVTPVRPSAGISAFGFPSSSVHSSDGAFTSSPAGFGSASLYSGGTIPSSPILPTNGVKRGLDVVEEGDGGMGIGQRYVSKKFKHGMGLEDI
ncbi:hypothetical protein HDK77DRAFT_479195 [Phyllosticta capitalensis]|uniref:uncharacterized protein n=1 Tax=Phyllosticta capitalensis TaxID=121624 RepID=UPI003132190F